MKRGKSQASLASPPPSIRMGWGWGCSWLVPPLSFVLANMWVGAGGKGQLLQMTTLYLSYVLNSLFPGPFILNLNPYPTLTVVALANSLRPVPTLHPGSSCDRMVFSSCFLWKSWKDEIVRDVNDSLSYKIPLTIFVTSMVSPILHA